MRAIARSAVVLLSGLIAFGGASAAAGAHQRKSRPLVLHPRFHVVGNTFRTDGPYVAGIDGPYVLVLTPVGNGQASGTVIDEQTGAQTSVSYPGCSWSEFIAVQFGGPWLVLIPCQSGSGGFELYNLYSGERTTVVPGPRVVSLEDECNMPEYCGGGVQNLGAHWIEWEITPCRYCTAKYLFQNIDTGQVRSLRGWRPGGRIIPDLDSQSLAQPVCPPLTVPRGIPPIQGRPAPGALSFYGPFAIASVRPGYGGVLERCGSRLKLPVGSRDLPLAASSHAIVWAKSSSRRLQGLFLPSLRRFVIATPATGTQSVVLSSGELYVFDDDSGRVFATRAPTQSHH
jgi:hypothetical protein